MSENLLLCYAINKKRSISSLVSVTLAQSRKVFKELVGAIEGSHIIKKKNEQTLELELINGSQIFFKSAEQGTASLRGYTVNGILILDEASFLKEDILEAVLPWCNVHKPPILIVSTPKFKNCFFYRFFQYGKEGKKGYVSIDWNEYDLSEFLSPERLEEFRTIMPANQFKSEYLGEFLDDDAIVFAGFRKCIKPSTKRYERCFAGIDWGTGSGGDSTSISILNEDCEQIAFYNFNDKSTTQQIDYIASILEPLKAHLGLVLCEDNSIGTPMSQLLKEKLKGLPIETATTTNKTKNEMVADLQVAFEQGEIKIMDIEKQTTELESYSLEYNPKTKVVTYNAPQGMHDDTCIALMLSLKAYKQGTKRGRYILA